ncbi:MAG TPA: FecR family protein [Paenalcaligenes sp.]|nr:FecR family protein [Paenalcaligenes sp.]
MTYFKLISAQALSAMALLVSSPLAWAQEAATTLFVQGQVTAESTQHGQRDLAKADPVFNSDRVNTHDDGRAQLRFSDGGLVSLMPDTLFTVEEYFYEDDEEGTLVFGLLKGGLRTMTGTIGSNKHEQYELKTPVATLGIRGTEYVAVLNPPNTLRVHVGRGKVVLTNDHGTLEIPEGHNGIVVQGQAPALGDEPPTFASITDNFLDEPAERHFSDPLTAEDLLDFPELSLDSLPEPAMIEPDDPLVPEDPFGPEDPFEPEDPYAWIPEGYELRDPNEYDFNEDVCVMEGDLFACPIE